MKKLIIVYLCAVALFLTGAVAIPTIDSIVIESKIVSSWGELLQKHLDFREMHGSIVPPPVSSEDVYTRMEADDFSFLAEDWSFRFTGGTYYIDDAPEFCEPDVSVLTPEETHVYFFDELAPRRIVWEVALKPEADAWSDLVLNARSAPAPTESVAEADGLGYGGMMMGMGGPPPEYTNDLWIGGGPVSNGLNVVVYVPEGFTNRVEIYRCPDLLSNVWTVAVENLRPVSTNPAVWWYPMEEDAGFFVAGDMDTDSDSDSICDAREKYVYKTKADDPDSDGDLCSDYQELYVAHTDPNNDDTSPPLAWITAPAATERKVVLP